MPRMHYRAAAAVALFALFAHVAAATAGSTDPTGRRQTPLGRSSKAARSS
jgi:hypothetical protein